MYGREREMKLSEREMSEAKGGVGGDAGKGGRLKEEGGVELM